MKKLLLVIFLFLAFTACQVRAVELVDKEAAIWCLNLTILIDGLVESMEQGLTEKQVRIITAKGISHMGLDQETAVLMATFLGGMIELMYTRKGTFERSEFAEGVFSGCLNQTAGGERV